MSNPVAVSIPHGETPASVQEYLMAIMDHLRARGVMPRLSSAEGLSTLRWDTNEGTAEILVEDNAHSLLYVVRQEGKENDKAHFKLGTPVATLDLL